MRIRQITVLGLVLFLTSPVFAADGDQCDAHDWFQQNTPTKRNALSLLCQGNLDASFDRRKSALQKLRRVIESNPQGDDSYEAHAALLSMFFRAGQYRKALEQADVMHTLKRAAEDVINERSLLLGLATNPDQSGKARHSFLAKSGIEDGNPHLRVLGNNKAALWFMDTGANISAMSDAEAAALGLVVRSVDTKMTDVSGTEIPFKITEVEKLTIGRTELKHVSFIVLPHTQPPFDDIPTEQQAVLGIQVLWALRSIHVDQTQQVEIDGAADPGAPSSPLAFYQSQPVTQMSFEGKELTVTLDTGATHTTLNPPFAKAFPETMTLGKEKEHTLTGIGGSTTQHSILIEKLRFTLAGKNIALSPANVLLQKTTGLSEWAAGNLGYDLIRQTAPFTIDFRTMRLSAR